MDNPLRLNYLLIMVTVLTKFLGLMPLWFGLFFLGPVMAELLIISLDIGLIQGALNTSLRNAPITFICMTIGGVYGFIAFKTGRWI